MSCHCVVLHVTVINILHKFLYAILISPIQVGARYSVVGRGTMLRAGSLRVRFPMWPFDFSIDLIFPAALGS
jgi:hypothetical protein